MTHPIPYTWTGEAMAPHKGFARRADAQFVIGQNYTLDVIEARSSKSHAHYFACVSEAWKNLPASMADQFPTDEHLRKFALIRSGFRNERQFVASSRAEALRLVAFMRPVDEYSIVQCQGCIVTVWTAQSQNLRAMDRARFQASKDAVLDYVALLIGARRDELDRAGMQVAV